MVQIFREMSKSTSIPNLTRKKITLIENHLKFPSSANPWDSTPPTQNLWIALNLNNVKKWAMVLRQVQTVEWVIRRADSHLDGLISQPQICRVNNVSDSDSSTLYFLYLLYFCPTLSLYFRLVSNKLNIFNLFKNSRLTSN